MEHDHVFALGDVSLAGQDASKLPATAQVSRILVTPFWVTP